MDPKERKFVLEFINKVNNELEKIQLNYLELKKELKELKSQKESGFNVNVLATSACEITNTFNETDLKKLIEESHEYADLFKERSIRYMAQMQQAQLVK